MVAMALGAAGALAAAGAGVYAANKNAQSNARTNALAEQNYLFNRMLAQRQYELSTAATQDARGNRTVYMPGVGWVERPSGQTGALIAASDSEEGNRLRQDAIRSRMRRSTTFQAGLRDRSLADSLLARAQLTQQSPDTVRAGLVRTGIADSVAAPNALRGAINLTALRQGSGGETALAELAQRGIQDRRSVLARADATAPAAFSTAEDSRMNGPLNRYNTLSARASAPDDVPFVPNTLADNLTSSRLRQQSIAPQGLGAASNVRSPTILAVDDRLPVRIGSAAAALEGFASNPSVNALFRRLLGRGDGSQSSSTPEPSRGSVFTDYGTRF